MASPSVVTVHVHDALGRPSGQGSGVVWSAGEVATNCHVLKDGARYVVRHRGRDYPATLKQADWERDVCSLSVPVLAAPAVRLGNTRDLKVGQKVYAIGAPRGLELTLSEGIVSALREVSDGRYLQITAPISPGSSGGGLFDQQGRLLGLTTFYLSEGQQLNFAVPVEWVQALAKRGTIAKPTPQETGRTTSEWLARALALQERKDWDALIEHAQSWIRAQPNEPLAWFSLGLSYAQAGQNAKEIEAYQQALRVQPEFAEAWYNLGVAYHQAGQSAKAIEAYQQALRIRPDAADAWHNLGIAYSRLGQTAKAIEALQQALRIRPEFAEAWYKLGTTYIRLGQTAKAIEALQQALRIRPEFADAWNDLALSYSLSGQTAKAIEASQQALRIRPEDADALTILGLAYAQAGHSAKAIEAFQQAVRIQPENAKAWFALGAAYRLAGQRGQVLEVYQRLRAIDGKLAAEFFDKFVLP